MTHLVYLPAAVVALVLLMAVTLGPAVETLGLLWARLRRRTRVPAWLHRVPPWAASVALAWLLRLPTPDRRRRTARHRKD